MKDDVYEFTKKNVIYEDLSNYSILMVMKVALFYMMPQKSNISSIIEK